MALDRELYAFEKCESQISGYNETSNETSCEKVSHKSLNELLHEGHNCWRITSANSGRFLIDGASYYEEIHHAILNAQKEIIIAGWELAADLNLVPESLAGNRPTQLAELLRYVLDENSDLRVYILIWDAFPFFAFDRQTKHRLRKAYKHDRLHLHFHKFLPTFASFHQKLVVIDDNVAFCGGIDLAANRIDTPEHSIYGKKRSLGHIPIHDVQIRLDGEAAKGLGELLKDDWQKATGHRIERTNRISDKRIPETAVKPLDLGSGASRDFSQARVAISRTRALYGQQECHREIEQALIDLISAAQKEIYIETQYLSSKSVGIALEQALQKPEGPEIIIVTSCIHLGWWEKRTLGAFRNRILDALKKSDRYGRLGVFYPALPEATYGVKVHSKILVIDDLYAMVGSANLTNRSMGFDSECSVILDASGESESGTLRGPIEGFKHQLVSEHLGLSLEEFIEERKQCDSLLRLIHKYDSWKRALRPLRAEHEDIFARILVTRKWSDPDEGLSLERKVASYIQKQARAQIPLTSNKRQLSEGSNRA